MKKNSSHGMSSVKASAVKNSGHASEVAFNSLFGKKSVKDMNFSGAGADCEVQKENYIKVLKDKFNIEKFTVSLKAAKTWQFHLGVIPELSDKEIYIRSLKTISLKNKSVTSGTHNIDWEKQQEVLRSKSFWDKYLKKGELLVYTSDKESYYFFRMDDVIDFIINNFSWRLLETGRIKGDVINKSGKIQKGRITFEFRDDDSKKCFVLGAHSGQNGHKFFLILKEFLDFELINPFK